MKSELDTLIEEYTTLIIQDHHKDRDCHFSIVKHWEYGEFIGYYIEHHGYCHSINDITGCSEVFKTYEEAQNSLIIFLKECIKEEKKNLDKS